MFMLSISSDLLKQKSRNVFQESTNILLNGLDQNASKIVMPYFAKTGGYIVVYELTYAML